MPTAIQAFTTDIKANFHAWIRRPEHSYQPCKNVLRKATNATNLPSYPRVETITQVRIRFA